MKKAQPVGHAFLLSPNSVARNLLLLLYPLLAVKFIRGSSVCLRISLLRGIGRLRFILTLSALPSFFGCFEARKFGKPFGRTINVFLKLPELALNISGLHCGIGNVGQLKV